MESPALVQVIRTVWTKASRGGELATKRNAVPDALPFAAALGRDASVGTLVHRAEFREADRFAMPASSDSGVVVDSRVRVLGVLVERSASGLRVSLDLDPALGVIGAPARTAAVERRPPAHFQLQPGQWGRVVYNGRHSDDQGWWYEKVVANVALPLKFDSQVFLRGRPVRELSEMAELW